MKLNPKIPIKRTKKLFLDTYRYKVVIVSALASMFRGNDLDSVSKKLAYYRLNTNTKPVQYWSRHMSTDDIDLAEHILKLLSPMSDYVLRVEAPFISAYTNNLEDIKKITDNLTDFVKYVSLSENELEKGVVYLKKIDFDYKVTLGHIQTPQVPLVKWCDDNSKIRMPRTCKEQLVRGWGCKQRYFYVKDDRSLIMVKMFLGSNIQRIERVVKLGD